MKWLIVLFVARADYLEVDQRLLRRDRGGGWVVEVGAVVVGCVAILQLRKEAVDSQPEMTRQISADLSAAVRQSVREFARFV